VLSLILHSKSPPASTIRALFLKEKKRERIAKGEIEGEGWWDIVLIIKNEAKSLLAQGC
jgi:hypothetical protein